MVCCNDPINADPASSLAPNDCLPSHHHGECCRHRHRWGARDDGGARIVAMFGGEGYDGGWPWWLERVLAADGDRNTYYLVLDLMAITASSPIAANTVS